jgi:cytochrome c
VFVSPNILLEPASPGNKSRRIPEHLVAASIARSRRTSRAADFSLSNFLSAVRKNAHGYSAAAKGRVAMQRDAGPNCSKNNETSFPSMLLSRMRSAPPIPAGKAKRLRESNRKESEMRGVIFAAVLAMMGTGGASAQDAAAGEKVFAVCKACHQIGETAKNAVGPVLNGVIGRPAGTYPGFNYSDANKNSGLTWDEATFRDYIKDPRAKIPGTKMIYAGLKDEQKTGDLLAYLKQFDADGKKK